MRRYSRAEEERIRALRMVPEWTRSGLLDPTQGERLESELRLRAHDRLRAAGVFA